MAISSMFSCLFKTKPDGASPSLDYDSYLSYQWTSLYLSRDILKKTGEIGKVTQLVSDKVISEFKTPFFNH